MMRRMIPVGELFEKSAKSPAFRAAYDALEGEFRLARALIAARARARMTQAQLARRMGTTQAVVARLESGRVNPSARTLARFAAATGHTLRIAFDPDRRAPRARGLERSIAAP